MRQHAFNPEKLQAEVSKWLNDLAELEHHRQQSGRERRFVSPIIPAAHTSPVRNMDECAPLRISRAAVKMPELFQRAVEDHVNDFNNLLMSTTNVFMGNMASQQRSPVGINNSLRVGMKTSGVMMDATMSAMGSTVSYFAGKSAEFTKALFSGSGTLASFIEKQADVLDIVVNQNPEATDAIQARLGCQFDDESRFVHIAETDRTILYQVLPLQAGVVVRETGKPVIHRAPFILPEYIIDLLPYDGMSYIGAFANSGTPTYFMHLKDIMATEAVQVMTEEDLLVDLKLFSAIVHQRHGQKATISGICQGALPLLHGVCSPRLQLDDDVDTWIGTVPAYALSESRRFQRNMETIAEQHRDPNLITRLLPNGNRVVPGEPASLSMRMSDFSNENPISKLISDLKGAERGPMSQTAAALQHYLENMAPMPLQLTEMSKLCTTKPITAEGVFPSELFGEPVSLQHAIKKGIRLYVVAGGKDIVVDLPCALAMFQIPSVKEYKGASFYVVPGAGHIAPFTSCTVSGARNFTGDVGGALWYHLQREIGN